MEAGAGLVGLIGEFATGMELGVDDLDGGQTGLFMNVDRDAAAIVFDGTGSVFMQRDGDFRAIAVRGFVDAVVDDLPNEMVKTATVCGADIHAGTLTNTFEFRQKFDVVRGVIGLANGVFWHIVRQSKDCEYYRTTNKAKSRTNRKFSAN